MDLSALWTREKARGAAELNLVNVKPVNTERRASMSVAKDESESGGVPNGVNPTKVSIVVAASPTVKPSVGTKKKFTALSNSITTTYLRDRDRLFRLRLETSITPSPTKTMPHFSGNNEFAMEYADRAVRQFVPQPAPPQSALDSPGQTTNSASVARIQTNRSPSIRVNSIAQTP
ncbi:hypothetical protein PF008_g29938 [Phytophthora fragariae]|uniref:Uncharacterized protein n=1 Tax=Phytophthora fragariae TaxID=53985 RepID=A0A6G0Q719_9STRA|nr:hypothetical protein PF008_g29938 [Phytophthora fragariae]